MPWVGCRGRCILMREHYELINLRGMNWLSVRTGNFEFVTERLSSMHQILRSLLFPHLKLKLVIIRILTNVLRQGENPELIGSFMFVLWSIKPCWICIVTQQAINMESRLDHTFMSDKDIVRTSDKDIAGCCNSLVVISSIIFRR